MIRKSTKPKEEKRKVSWYEHNRCKFEQMGKQCRLLGTISSGQGEEAKFYCGFHFYASQNMKDRYNFESFKDWHEHHLTNICEDQFFKYKTTTAWQMMGN